VRVISPKALRDFWRRHPDAETPLRTWLSVNGAAAWSGPAEIKAAYASASFLGGDRVVFNIGGNKYRLVVQFNFRKRIAYIRFIGTHRDYDRIDAASV
jgi:mRNA interferase HigB